ncbi:uncharacterized protein BDR25DRAFT_66025 [Lindgomyces ingoldianus]|uniref:Uncharacterized protein n=1 Tax=Lindgomyces ingoldianus TaxID=673940 RepID=A0ACB6RCI4_9PLEO|nr:uncharacterized protein BDR25DRAFT_66025 [Lindgomyces ingoldianus]KAF2476440.1 hypothetical protein BDR25DRAFT_66025 [Lindgomyces ingoldianus]
MDLFGGRREASATDQLSKRNGCLRQSSSLCALPSSRHHSRPFRNGRVKRPSCDTSLGRSWVVRQSTVAQLMPSQGFGLRTFGTHRSRELLHPSRWAIYPCLERLALRRVADNIFHTGLSPGETGGSRIVLAVLPLPVASGYWPRHGVVCQSSRLPLHPPQLAHRFPIGCYCSSSFALPANGLVVAAAEALASWVIVSCAVREDKVSYRDRNSSAESHGGRPFKSLVTMLSLWDALHARVHKNKPIYPTSSYTISHS